MNSIATDRLNVGFLGTEGDLTKSQVSHIRRNLVKLRTQNPTTSLFFYSTNERAEKNACLVAEQAGFYAIPQTTKRDVIDSSHVVLAAVGDSSTEWLAAIDYARSCTKLWKVIRLSTLPVKKKKKKKKATAQGAVSAHN